MAKCENDANIPIRAQQERMMQDLRVIEVILMFH